MSEQSRTLAVLGPTNTGKTHFAIERMLGYRTGVIGLPLRLLAREIYDRIVAVRGPSVVALVTGEERIVPERAQYWVCTVEAMPDGMGTDFVAVDEIQLCADPERGHVFTDRLLRMRGLRETQFLGSHTMRSVIANLVPGVEFLSRERMSQLSYSGPKKISKMPARSAIVGFSVENVYAMAELLRRQKGGAAVVMGALSPRTRNAQVALYQNGDVDYLVATDAIGMGLNLDINHVAFSSLTKFDGRRMRHLQPNELGQIAGRAGRGMSHGTFGVTGEAPDLDPDLAQAIMEHRFAPIRKLEWRNARLAFGSTQSLIASLEAKPEHELLAARARPTIWARSRRWRHSPMSRRVPPMRPRCGCCGMSAESPIFAASAMPNMRACSRRSIAIWCNMAGCPTTGWHGRSSGSIAPMAISTHCRNGWRISAHGPMSHSARAGWMTKIIGAALLAR